MAKNPSKNVILGKIDISSLLMAYQKSESGLRNAKTDLEKAGAIQYFEFTFELAWKTMRRILVDRGKTLNSPKTVFREAALEHLIEDPEIWFSFINDRNETVHTYNHKKAHEIFSHLNSFDDEMKKFIRNIQHLDD
ncbi:MAG: hypothetical protein A4S09_06215 [Proteobacteria bacterium SG_bin7]|nr:MAG: hypothetical protein A4S09_06215 [Proteobacteria bacterium SG_bin7]